MGLTLGVFDVFTYVAPGALYLTLAGFVAARAGWLDSTSPVG